MRGSRVKKHKVSVSSALAQRHRPRSQQRRRDASALPAMDRVALVCQQAQQFFGIGIHSPQRLVINFQEQRRMKPIDGLAPAPQDALFSPLNVYLYERNGWPLTLLQKRVQRDRSHGNSLL